MSITNRRGERPDWVVRCRGSFCRKRLSRALLPRPAVEYGPANEDAPRAALKSAGGEPADGGVTHAKGPRDVGERLAVRGSGALSSFRGSGAD